MARIRTIKPEFWTDEKVVALSPMARLLFIGLWNFVDDDGRGEFSPIRMKMQILPADSADVSELLGEIRREGLITVYEVEAKEYFSVNGFSKHQKVDHRSTSKCPPPPSSAEFPRVPPPEGKGMEGIKEGNSEAKASGANAPATVVPIDAKTALFREGIDTLSAMTGREPYSLKSQVGRWMKLTGEDCASILGVIRQARAKNVIEPIAWIEAALKPRDPDADIYRGVL